MRSIVGIGASVPAFLGKLWKLVNDVETNHLISWSPGGKTFVIKNQADFAKELLPLYYKHNNMASFIRQLNMYGFHKITSVENGGLRYEKDEIEFSHPCFMKGHAYLLEHIKRKIANPKALLPSNEGEKMLVKPELMTKVLADVKQMKGKQENLDSKFSAMKQENEALWREIAILRQKHVKQQRIVNNLIQFLMSLVQPARQPQPPQSPTPPKRPLQLMINNAAYDSSDSSFPRILKKIKLDEDAITEELNEENLEDGPTIHELIHEDLHNEVTEDPLNPAHFVQLDMSNTSPRAQSGHSPIDPNTVQYHVTMEDGDDSEPVNGSRVVLPVGGNNVILKVPKSMPVVTTPSPTTTTPTPAVAQQVIGPVQNNVNGKLRTSKTKQNNLKKLPSVLQKNLVFPSNFNAINPSADLNLPAEIFASDDSVSDAGVAASEDMSIKNLLQNTVQAPVISTAKDKLVGGITIKMEKPINEINNKKNTKKSNKINNEFKLANIKTEVQDDSDWNMSLATVNNNTDVDRFHNVNKRDYIDKNLEDYSSSLFGTNSNKNDIDDHLDAMQTDLDSLRELLRSDSYTFDTNTLLGNYTDNFADEGWRQKQRLNRIKLFGSEDPFYGLTYNGEEEHSKTPNGAKMQKDEIANVSSGDTDPALFYVDDAEGNQLMSYTGNIPDFEDMNMAELQCEDSQEELAAEPEGGSVLNTPQVQLCSPSYQP